MINEEIVLQVGKPFLRPIGITQMLFLLSFFVSPFIWIWFGWGLAWKVALTGISGIVFSYWLYQAAKSITEKEIEKKLSKIKRGE